MSLALIMAGGRSERMRATFGRQHKAMVRVSGVPMLERNICKLLSFAFSEIVIAVNSQEPEIVEYILTRGRALALARGASLGYLKEEEPLGTIGIARKLMDRSDALLVVNVDNLTALDLRRLLNHHLESKAALTIATHVEPFQIPFGEVNVSNGRITEYLEKPTRWIRVSSGTCVLGPKAFYAIGENRPMSVPDLFAALLGQGERVAAFEHDSAWIDVNDATAVNKAERLISDHLYEFEYWDQKPDYELAAILLHTPSGIIVEHRSQTSSRYRSFWDMPGTRLGRGDGDPARAIARKVQQQQWGSVNPDFLTSFDDLDTTTGKLLRHHVFFARIDETLPASSREGEQRYMTLEEANSLPSLSAALVRSFASLGGQL